MAPNLTQSLYTKLSKETKAALDEVNQWAQETLREGSEDWDRYHMRTTLGGRKQFRADYEAKHLLSRFG